MHHQKQYERPEQPDMDGESRPFIYYAKGQWLDHSGVSYPQSGYHIKYDRGKQRPMDYFIPCIFFHTIVIPGETRDPLK